MGLRYKWHWEGGATIGCTQCMRHVIRRWDRLGWLRSKTKLRFPSTHIVRQPSHYTIAQQTRQRHSSNNRGIIHPGHPSNPSEANPNADNPHSPTTNSLPLPLPITTNSNTPSALRKLASLHNPSHVLPAPLIQRPKLHGKVEHVAAVFRQALHNPSDGGVAAGEGLLEFFEVGYVEC